MSGEITFIGAIIVLCTMYIYITDPVHTSSFITIDGEKFNIQESYSDKKQAAIILKELNERIMYFLAYLKQKYNINDIYKNNPRSVQAKIAGRILRNYNPEAIIENDPRTSSDTSYTIKKGQRMYICLRSKTSPYRLHNIDLLLFIVLHEISHMGAKTYGHNDEFWQTFKFILTEATFASIYHPINYARYPVEYCGLQVNYNPLFDK